MAVKVKKTVNFRYVPKGFKGSDEDLDQLNENINHTAMEEGYAPFSQTTIGEGRKTLLTVFLNPKTTKRNLKDMLDRAVEVGRDEWDKINVE